MPLATLIRKECFLKVGLLRNRLSGIDDWDLFTRIAELYPVVILDEPVGLYRQPTATSGQGSSVRAAQLRRVERHQRELLKLPRAMAASPAQRRAARRRALNRIADTLLFGAAQKILNRDSSHVPSNVLTAMRLRPSRLIRPSSYKKFANLYFFKPGADRVSSSW
jgi:hypothetical protein